MTAPTLRFGCGKVNDIQATQKEFYDLLNAEFHFDHDPCPIWPDGIVKVDGLSSEWGECNYVNPPYSAVDAWVKKAVIEMKKGRKSVLLTPARTNNIIWRDVVSKYASEYRFLYRCVRFGVFTRPLPNPLVVVIFDPAVEPKDRKEQHGEFVWFTLK